MLRIASSLLMLSCFVPPSASAQDTTIVGDYWSEERAGIVRLFLVGDVLYGRALWRREPTLDEENPNPDLRSRSIVGMVFLRDFRRDGDEWTGGTVYSPDNGNTYRGNIWLESPNVLKMRGYVGIPLFGRTATFQRVRRGEYPDGVTPQ
ncbi:MAG: DUF2147 domain-containing protein [Myxococcota bacterium]